MSRDHDWGCRLTVLVDEAARAVVPAIVGMLEEELPETFRGLPVRFPVTWDTTISHKVEVATVTDFATSRLGVNAFEAAGTPSAIDWLTMTGQGVLEVTAGQVFADATRELSWVRAMLAWYPSDVELYALASGWQRLAQRMPMVGRTADRGDALGSRLLSAALAVDLRALAFLVSRRWAPYSKWRGLMFSGLPIADELADPLGTAVASDDWREREAALAACAEVVLGVQRGLGLPTPTAAIGWFWDRPYRTIDPAVPDLLVRPITDPLVRALTKLAPGVGAIEQWVSSQDVLANPERRRGAQAAYRAWLEPTVGA